MNKGEEKKIHEILESGSIGYAYLFDAKARKTLEKVVSLEPENLAALFRKYGTEMEWMSVTDMREWCCVQQVEKSVLVRMRNCVGR